MAFTIQKEPPPADPKPTRKEEGYSDMIWLAAVMVVGGFYLYMIHAASGMAQCEKMEGIQLALGAGKLAQDHPVFLALISIASFIPAILLPQFARPYLLRVVLVFSIVWAGVFLVTFQPVAKAVACIQKTLSTERPMPETIRGL